MRNRLLYRALRVTAGLLPFLPLSVVYGFASAAGWLAYFLVRPAREGILSNLAVALPHLSNRERSRIARSAFQHDAKNWVDTLRIGRLSAREIVELVDLEGWQHLEHAAAAGQGVILTTMHLGNFDLVGQVVTANGYRLTVPVERMEPEQLFTFLLEQRESKGIRTVPIERAPREMLNVLRSGELLGIAADRVIHGRGHPILFFRRPALLPYGPASLARHTGAPILLGVGIRIRGNRFQARVIPLLGPDAARSRDSEGETMHALVGAMESLIREYPEQWLAFSPIWQYDIGGEGPATMEPRRKAAVQAR